MGTGAPYTKGLAAPHGLLLGTATGGGVLSAAGGAEPPLSSHWYNALAEAAAFAGGTGFGLSTTGI